MRADILLWSLRYFKSRNIASQACKSGRIKILGKSIKPSKEIFIGDKISINKNKTLKDITVLKLPKKRIGAKIIDLHRKEELIIKNSSKINDKTISIKRIKGSGRPTKKERREIDKYSVKWLSICNLLLVYYKSAKMKLDSSKIILKSSDISYTVRRIAYQILETNLEEESIILAGVYKNGSVFADRIKSELKKISPVKIELIEINIDKKNQQSGIKVTENIVFKNKSIVVIDDVLNTGKTLIHSTNYFLSKGLKKIQTAVLVNRNHKIYPIKADFKGISLSTSIKEHISVVFNKNEGIYLS